MRDDLTSSIPDFITLCEARNNLRLRTREMEARTTLSAAGDGVTYTLPTDFVEVRSLVSNVDPTSVLKPASLDQARNFYSTADYPYFYVIQGDSLYVYPPNTADLTLDYFSKIPALSDSNETNWLLTKAPQVYLYGTLMESAPFLADDQRTMVWAQLYQVACDELSKADQRAKHSKATPRLRVVII
jgi:hypothetical protein